jgi:hypothetical protein
MTSVDNNAEKLSEEDAKFWKTLIANNGSSSLWDEVFQPDKRSNKIYQEIINNNPTQPTKVVAHKDKATPPPNLYETINASPFPYNVIVGRLPQQKYQTYPPLPPHNLVTHERIVWVTQQRIHTPQPTTPRVIKTSLPFSFRQPSAPLIEKQGLNHKLPKVLNVRPIKHDKDLPSRRQQTPIILITRKLPRQPEPLNLTIPETILSQPSNNLGLIIPETILSQSSPAKEPKPAEVPRSPSPRNSDYRLPPLPPLPLSTQPSKQLFPVTPPRLIKPLAAAPNDTPSSPQNPEKNSYWYTSLSSAYQNFLAFYKTFKEDCKTAFTFSKKSDKTEAGDSVIKPSTSIIATFCQTLEKMTSSFNKPTSDADESEKSPLLQTQSHKVKDRTP